jgi:hypothetical protein
MRGFCLLITAVASVGCDGSAARIADHDGAPANDAGGIVALTTSVNGATGLNKLTPAQATQLCTDITAFATNSVCGYTGLYDGLVNAEISSIGGGVDDARLQMLCRNGDTAATCAALSCNPTQLASNPVSCTATVADLVACFTDTEVALKQQLGWLPACDTLTAAKVSAYNATMNDAGISFYVTPASCKALQATCSGYIQINSYSF